MAISITLDRLPAEFEHTARLLEQAGTRALRRAARRSIGTVQQTIDETLPHEPVDTGAYRRAWTVEDVDEGADLYNPTMYAPVIEYGSRPHTVPFDVLLDWARRKLRGTTRAGTQREQAARALAGGARKAIQRRGTAPRDILGRSSEKFMDHVKAALDAELARASRRR